MRLIDADKLIEEIKEWGFIGETCAVEAVESAPIIDIVFCKECKHWLDGSGLCKHWSKLYGSVLTKADDFCSYGCRKEYDDE